MNDTLTYDMVVAAVESVEALIGPHKHFIYRPEILDDAILIAGEGSRCQGEGKCAYHGIPLLSMESVRAAVRARDEHQGSKA